MKTHVLANDIVLLELSIDEHLTLSRSLCDLMSSIEPCDIERVLGSTPDAAYEFAYSVYIEEALGRLSGVEWLPAAGCSDALALGPASADPLVGVRFWEEGSLWRLTAGQFEFLRVCIDVRSHVVDRAA